jgi:Pyridoxamine 5'-phosphate oxidase
MQPSRSGDQRKLETLERLARDQDAWVASADEDGNAYLVPLGFYWDGSALILSTPSANLTARNLRLARRVRVGIGPADDVVLIDGNAQLMQPHEVADGAGDAFADKLGWDPRGRGGYQYFRIVPQRIQAFRSAAEAKDRYLMRDGHWLV